MYNFDKINKLLKDTCPTCRKVERCYDCPFVKGRGGELFTGPKMGIMNIPKYYLYYFLYRPELNFEFPILPEVDSKGISKDKYKYWRWEIHHKNFNHWDDNPENLELLLCIEHRRIHGKQSPINSSFWYNTKYKKSKISRSEKLKEKGKEGKHHNQTFEAKERLGRLQKKRISDGTHNFLGLNSGSPNTSKKKRLIEYLSNINQPTIITKDIVDKLDYHDLSTFKKSIINIIEKNDLRLKVDINKIDSRKFIDIKIEPIINKSDKV